VNAKDVENLKRAAAARALEMVEPGMRLGLGSGSTAYHFVELLAERVRGGLAIVGVPTSEATRAQATPTESRSRPLMKRRSSTSRSMAPTKSARG
jgi:Ribose 5-phosphate isomerase